MIAFLTSGYFRLLLVPLATAALGCFIRYFRKKIRRHKIDFEIFVVWPELMIAAFFNLMLLAADTAASKGNNGGKLINIYSANLTVLLLLWIVSFVAALPRKGKWRIVIWTYAFPFLVASATLELSLQLSRSLKVG
jgi:hypothetical protein